MARLIVIVPLVVLAVMIFALIDLLRIDESRVRGIPKPLWGVVIVFVPLVGSILWFALGRDRGSRPRQVRGPIAPDDDPAFLRGLGRDKSREETIRDQEERIRKLEQELSELDDDDPRKD